MATARRQIAAFRREAEQNCRKLAAAVLDAALTADQISLLVYAARRPDVLAIIGAVQKAVEAGASPEITPQLQVAEDN